jgi:hypothetical protein
LRRRDNKTNKQITPFFNKTRYSPGEDIALTIAGNDDYDELPERLDYKYKVEIDGRKIQDGSSEEAEIIIHYDSSYKSTPTISISGWKSTSDPDTIINIPVNKDLGISFYPEGGRCINGLQGKIAFKAMYSDGKSASFSGKIVDDSGKELDLVITEHEGMGVFMHTPVKGMSFYLIPDYESNPERFQLPKGEDQGWQMKIKFLREQLLFIQLYYLKYIT